MSNIPSMKQEKISTLQALLTVTSTVYAVGIVSLPRTIAEKTQTPDVWQGLLLASLLGVGVVFINVKLCQRFPGKTFYELNPVIAGKFIGLLINIAFIVHCTMICSLVCRMMAEFLKGLALERTPLSMILLPFLLLIGYLTWGGLHAMVRLVELFFPLTLIVFLLLIILNINHFNLDNLRPVFHKGWHPIFESLKVIPFSTIGFESLLILTNVMVNPQKAWKAGWIGYSIAMGLYLLMVTMVVGCMSVEEVSRLQWPVVSFAQQIEFPGSFLERFEILFIILWTIKIFMTAANYYFYMVAGISQLTQKWNRFICFLPLILIFSLSMYPQSFIEIGNFDTISGYFGIIMGAAVPLVLLIISMVFHRKGNPDGKQ
ncbi:GerAB/ArcD/ProY family transporter [Paenibacillus polymyxa]|uniref:GerAB/ArcD/ProY family transporter n=3 Tax=Paenibacillus TaxID=44249 RepID=A0A8I1LWT3_PAEPO|nr:GerAB/ArcD/ProY family transporter [Paenibacillus sp. EKM206P]KAF6586543.1 GerAB/ArcD/ProY family transporter [Paenibacillus sp. EKM205P]MBM0635187.1 GerAB/ArcD/ProY family transporter [Paenibacillus polymyxa]QNR67788.1 GerAB/ArcD/ProY family transporter [Paenibacillus peoriae]